MLSSVDLKPFKSKPPCENAIIQHLCLFVLSRNSPPCRIFDKKTAAGMKERDIEEVEIMFFLIYEAQHKYINQNSI